MEDKRITRTKEQFRQALAALLDQRPFEQITVKALCDQAGITRITFYAHYADKYELAEDMFQEMITQGTREYRRLQQSNNPADDPITGYCNLLDAILNLYVARHDFFRHTAPGENPYLASSFYSHVLEIVEGHTHRASSHLSPRYNVRAITAFLCFGLGGFISENTGPEEEVRRQARTILRDILTSDILTRRRPAGRQRPLSPSHDPGQ